MISISLTACGKPSHANVIVLVASASRNEPAPSLASPDLALLHQAGASSSDAIAYIVSPDNGQPIQFPLTPLRPDGQVEHGPDRDQLLDANVSRVQHALSQEAADKPFDLLTLIASATRVSPVPGTLIVVSSGLSTAGGLDFRQLGWDANPAAAATQLKQRGLLPELAKWHVVFSSLADTAGSQTPLPLPQQTELTGYWLAICQAAGAASCETDDVTRPDLPSLSSTVVPTVPIPPVASVQGPHHWAGKSIPDAAFFAFGSSRLLAGADAILEPLAAQAIARHLKVSVTGYASPDGGSATYNDTLSLARAESIRTRLVALGVPPSRIVSVTGAGTAGVTAAFCYRGGQLDEGICAQLRRVVILFSPPLASPPTAN
jgi:hypothetical protein